MTQAIVKWQVGKQSYMMHVSFSYSPSIDNRANGEIIFLIHYVTVVLRSMATNSNESLTGVTITQQYPIYTTIYVIANINIAFQTHSQLYSYISIFRQTTFATVPCTG